jgi:signal transduction histidine kinase
VRRRIVAATLLVALVAIGILGVPLLVITQNEIGSRTYDHLVHDAQVCALKVEPYVVSHTLTTARLDQLVADNPYVSVRLPSGQLYTTGSPPGGTPLRTTVNMAGGAVLTFERPPGDYYNERVESAAVIVIAAAVAIGVAVMLAGRVSTRLTTPLSRLADDAGRFGDGDLRPSGQRYGIPELDDVARVLDGAALRLSDLVRREREFAGDVSHQLRSRLTALSMRLEEVGASTDPNASREAEAALEQVDRMVSVIDDLLEQARNERARSAIPVNVAEQLDNVYDEWAPQLSSHGRKLRILPADGLRAHATPGHLQQAIGVLVENAITHGAGTVDVQAFRHGEHVVVEVTDEGPGVSDRLIGSVFARGVSGRGGTGLGLPLARALVEADSGRLELVRPKPATFAIYLPRLPAADKRSID